jgi:hypothetical protein
MPKMTRDGTIANTSVRSLRSSWNLPCTGMKISGDQTEDVERRQCS